MSALRADIEEALRARACTPTSAHEVVFRVEEPWQSEPGLWSCSAAWLQRRDPSPVWATATITNVPMKQLGPALSAALKSGVTNEANGGRS